MKTESARIEAAIASLLTDCDLPLQDATIVREYLGNEEYGIALEYLCDTLIDTEASITEDQCRRVLDTAKALGLTQREPRQWSERLETLLARVRQ